MTSDPWPFFPEIPIIGMDTVFMMRLIMLRKELGFPFPITSSLRDDGRHSLHNFGKAVDIGVRGEQAYRIVEAAPRHGFVGIGVSQKGNKRFIHLDTGGEGFPRPMIWSYT